MPMSEQQHPGRSRSGATPWKPCPIFVICHLVGGKIAEAWGNADVGSLVDFESS
jgi:hypothetical protein